MERKGWMQRRLDNRRAVRVERLRRRWRFDPDATAIAEIGPDGVPIGVRGGTRVAPSPVFTADSPRFVVGSVWLVILVMTLYGAGDVRSLVLHDEALARSSALVGFANGLYSLSSTLGPARLRASLDEVFAPMKQKTAGEWPAGGGEGAAAVAGTEPGTPGASGAPDGSGAPEAGAASEPRQTRVLLVGASSIEYYLGAELERRLETYEGVVVHRFGKLGTGLARPDSFDWPKQLAELLASFRPQVVIGQFGGNDAQPLVVGGGRAALFRTKEWDEEYARRVRAVVGQVQATGARMILLGMPVTRDKAFAGRIEHVNDITRQATEAGGGVYLSTWDLAADDRGAYRPTIRHNGKTGSMYLADGVHYSRLGSLFVAQRLCWRLERHLELLPGDEALAPVSRHEIDSLARGKKTRYLAFVPRRARKGEERLPVVFLLHGAEGSWTTFSERAHELLQREATERRLVLVTPDGDAHGWYLDSPRVPESQIETFIMKELLPDVELRLPINGRMGIAGISMGGNGALALAFKYPRVFAAVGSMSGAVDLSEAASRPALIERLGPYKDNRTLWEESSALHLAKERPGAARRVPVLLTVGGRDRWVKANRRLHEVLVDLGVDCKLEELAGGHEWSHWLAALPEHLSWQAEKLHEPRVEEADRGERGERRQAAQ